MSKITKASDDVTNAVQNVIKSMGLSAYCSFFVLDVTGQKQLVKIAKASPTTEYFSQTTESVIVYINEELYELLEPIQREMLIANPSIPASIPIIPVLFFVSPLTNSFSFPKSQ